MSFLPDLTFPTRAALTGFALCVLLSSAALAQHGDEIRPRPPRAYSLEPVSAPGLWRSDLRTLLQELERLHPDPYYTTPRATFDSLAAALEAEIPRLAAHEIIVGFARILALVGDGHTSLPLYFAAGVDFHALPLQFGIYDDGIYVEAADRAYAEIIGGRIVRMGSTSAEDALRRVTPLISRDNANWIATVAPHLLNRIELLNAVGIAETLEELNLTVVADGEERSMSVLPLSRPPRTSFGVPFLQDLTDDWVDARDRSAAPVPLYQKRFDDIYWWEYLEEHDLLYIKWDQVQNRPDGLTALDMFREATAFAKAHRPAKTVIDIRNNTGGEGGLLPPIIREIVRTPEIDEPGKLFVVIGRRTFSAAQMMSAYLERFTTAIFVGEPSSAVYNGYAGHAIAHLPNSGITFMISPDYYQMGNTPRDARGQATPHLAAVPTFADYADNRDPALEVILDYEPEVFEHDVRTALAEGDTARVVSLIRAFDADPVNRFAGSRSRLNALGYRLLNEGRVSEALTILQINVRLHPDYANGWDSLGEALVKAGHRDEAVAAFRKAIEIAPGFAPSQAWLHRLGAD